MIETERLLLRKPRLDDCDGVARYLGDPEVMRFLAQRWIDDWGAFRAGTFVVQRKDDGAVLGRVGLNFFDARTWERSADPDAQPELGWALAREHWGNGYATEAAPAVRTWADVGHLVSLIAPDDVRSQRVAERLGAKPVGSMTFPDSGPAVIWEHP